MKASQHQYNHPRGSTSPAKQVCGIWHLRSGPTQITKISHQTYHTRKIRDALPPQTDRNSSHLCTSTVDLK